MSKIDELIREYCPEGVEFASIQSIFDLRNGYTPSKSNKDYWTDGTIPWFRMEDIRANGRVLKNSLQYINKTAAKGSRVFPANSILVATSATIGEHALITVPHLSNQRFTSLSLKDSFRSRMDMKFVFYYCFVLNDWCLKNTTTSSFSSVDMGGFKKFKFPIPPLEVQKEIVKILDTFTQLEAELAAELAARKAQYEHYRNQLLTFDNAGGVRRTMLGEIAMYSNARIEATDLNHENYVGVDNILQNRAGKTTSDYVPSVGRLTRFDDGDVLIGNIRPYLKKLWHADRTGGTNGDVLVLKLKKDDEILPRYLYQLLASDKFFSYNMQFSKGTKMPRGDKASILKYPISIPSISTQEKAIEILDKFDTLVNDISKGLPAEITARHQQYEYYRTKLLTFEELIV